MASNKHILRAFRFLLMLVMLSGFASVAEARTGILLKSSVEDAQPPMRWLAMIPGSNRYIAERRAGWGFLETPPGEYMLMVIPKGAGALPVEMGRVEVTRDQVTEVDLDSGIRLSSSKGLDPLPGWIVMKQGSDEAVAQVRGRWGFTPLPPGGYRIEAPIPGFTGTVSPVRVSPHSVTEVDLAQLGIGQMVVEMPAQHNVRLLFGGTEVFPLLELDGEYYDLSDGDSPATGPIKTWIEARPIAIERVSGSFVHRVETEIRAGERTELPFDPAEIAASRGLSLIEFERAEEGLDVDLLTVIDRFGNRALLSESEPSLDPLFLAPGGVRVRATINGSEVLHGPVEPGRRTRIELRAPSAQGREQTVSTLDVAIENPADGATLDPDATEVTVVGHASTTSTAGTTKMVLAIDTSGSTDEPSGADLDGDGETETILEAEVAAALDLIDALLDVEADSPGTAFALSIVRFSNTAEAIAPLTRLTDSGGVARLKSVLENLLVARSSGDTFYDRALDAAMRVFQQTDTPGPEITLLVSDGKPSDPISSFDAAARVGLQGVVLHAIGLGPDFANVAQPTVSYPPVPEMGAEILATVAALGHSGGRIWPLPRPADIVKLVPDLPILERPDAAIDTIAVENTTIGESAVSIDLRRDGSFEARVPVRFAQDGASSVNRLRVFATSADGDLEATEVVRVQSQGVGRELQKQLSATKNAEGRAEQAEQALAAAQDEIASLEKTAAQRAQERDAAKQALGDAKSEHERELRKQLSATKNAEGRAEQAEQALAAAQDEIASLEKTAAQREAQLSQERDAAKQALADAKSEHERELRQQLSATKDAGGRAEQAEQALAAAQDEIASLEKTAAQREAQIDAQSRAAASDLEQCVDEARQCASDLELALSNLFSAIETAETVVLNVPADVLFAYDSSTIEEDAAESLRLAATFISRHPRSNLIIEGHSDSIGSSEYNLELSEARSEAVADWLVEHGGLAGDRIETRGLGESQPAAAETTADGLDDPAGRQRNRRVEIRIIK